MRKLKNLSNELSGVFRGALYKKHAELSFGKLLRNYFKQKIGYTHRRVSAFSQPASVNTLPT